MLQNVLECIESLEGPLREMQPDLDLPNAEPAHQSALLANYLTFPRLHFGGESSGGKAYLKTLTFSQIFLS